MKATLFFILMLFFQPHVGKNPSSNDTCTSSYDTILHKNVYSSVDKEPEYPRGTDKLLSDFLKRFRYPKQETYQGAILLEFIVDTDGTVVESKAIQKEFPAPTSVDSEAIRVLNSLSKWKPGKCNGKVVPVRMHMPIHF